MSDCLHETVKCMKCHRYLSEVRTEQIPPEELDPQEVKELHPPKKRIALEHPAFEDIPIDAYFEIYDEITLEDIPF